MRRQIWLKNPETGTIWNLLPDDPHAIDGGCALIKPQGMGYEQDVTQEQVEFDYFVSQIKSKNHNITGTLYFNGDQHLQNFQRYIGDFHKQFLLYYSPNGEYQPYDQISSPYYKPVIIARVDKSEKETNGWYECEVTFATQSDVWKRDVYLIIDGARKMRGEPLVYPYKYTYVLGGRDIYEIQIPNTGREVGCIVRIKNKAAKPISQVEWFIDNTIIGVDGRTITTTQRSKWYTQRHETGEVIADVTLYQDYELLVDSNATTQEAKVVNSDGISQSVVDWQEPSWDYINFIRIKNGDNRIVFYIDGDEVDISVIYQEQKEII